MRPGLPFASQSGHPGQYSTGILLFNVVYAMREWCVRNYSYFVFSAVAQEVYFYASVYEAVTYLVRDYAISGHRSLRLSEFGGGEVAHSNKSYFACIHQVFHSSNGLLNGYSASRRVELI